jgi:hypothetical protein
VGKTESIKERAIYVYLPSVEHKERWEKHSEKLGVSISKFVIEYVENSLRQEEEPDYKSRSLLWKENNELKQQVEDLARKCRLLETVVDKLEQELRGYRGKPFLETGFESVRSYEKRLIDLLKSRDIVADEQIFAQLGIAPSDSNAVRGIAKQLESLEVCGLVKSSSRGWKWTG